MLLAQLTLIPPKFVKMLSHEQLIAITLYGRHPDDIAQGELSQALTAMGVEISRTQLWRVLSDLNSSGLITQSGAGRWRKYGLTNKGARFALTGMQEVGVTMPPKNLVTPDQAGAGILDNRAEQAGPEDIIDPAGGRPPVEYNFAFLERYIPNQTNFFSDAEISELLNIGTRASGSIAANGYFKRISERLTIDFAFSSSKLEGNEYDYLDTENLVLWNERAEDKSEVDAQMILNHKDAISYLLENHEHLELNPFMIRSLHAQMMNGLIHESMCGTPRSLNVNIRDSSYRPLRFPAQLDAELAKLTQKVQQVTNPFEASLLLLVHLSYLQYFVDGNKRVGRISSNIPLFKNGMCPLSFMGINRTEYHRGLRTFYETNDLSIVKKTFLEAYRKSNEIYIDMAENRYLQEVKTDPQMNRHVLAWVKSIVTKTVEEGALLDPADEIAGKSGLGPAQEGSLIEQVRSHLQHISVIKCLTYRLNRDQVESFLEIRRAANLTPAP